jgi:hypothetical protein
VIWAEGDTTYDIHPNRDSLYFADGVHKTIPGHHAYYEALMPLLLAPDGPLGDRLTAASPSV